MTDSSSPREIRGLANPSSAVTEVGSILSAASPLDQSLFFATKAGQRSTQQEVRLDLLGIKLNGLLERRNCFLQSPCVEQTETEQISEARRARLQLEPSLNGSGRAFQHVVLIEQCAQRCIGIGVIRMGVEPGFQRGRAGTCCHLGRWGCAEAGRKDQPGLSEDQRGEHAVY
jgi:hypothetical protein